MNIFVKFYCCTFSVGTFRQTPCVCSGWGAGSPGRKWQKRIENSVANSFIWNRAGPIVVKQFVWIIPSVLGKRKKSKISIGNCIFTWSSPVGGASIWARAIPAAKAANANTSKTTLVQSFISMLSRKHTRENLTYSNSSQRMHGFFAFFRHCSVFTVPLANLYIFLIVHQYFPTITKLLGRCLPACLICHCCCRCCCCCCCLISPPSSFSFYLSSCLKPGAVAPLWGSTYRTWGIRQRLEPHG